MPNLPDYLKKEVHVFEVPIKNQCIDKHIDGVALRDQLKCMGYPARKIEFIAKLKAKISTLIL
jgi:hypothetical protein